MKKRLLDHASGIIFPDASKILFKMKLTLIIILSLIFGAIASESYSQTAKLSLDIKNTTVKDVLGVIEKQSEFYFLYSEKIIDVNRAVNISVRESSVEKVLDKIFEGTNVKYTILDRQIILTTPTSNTPSGSNREGQQQKVVTGKVTDASGTPLPGVSVVIKGTTIGVVTDVHGSYSITKVPDNAILQFSFIGMKSQEVVVGDKTVINVTLEQEAIGLDEFVAVGYGTQKKRNVIGSVSTVKSKDLVNPIVTDFNSMLQGKASGVYVSGGTVRVRGMNSISNSTEPLYVIDGIVMANAAGLINPNDIESIEVLKDASATAIYGSRASNGVIMITTKSGKSGKTSTSININSGFSQSINDGFIRADTDTQLAAMDMAIHNSSLHDANVVDVPYDPKAAFSNVPIFQNDEKGAQRDFSYFTRDYIKNIHTDLADAISQTTTFTEANVSTNKSFEKGSVFFSMLGRTENSQFKGNATKKGIARFGGNFMPVKNFKLGFNTTTSYNAQTFGTGEYFLNRWMPYMPLLDTTNITGYWVPNVNPLLQANKDYIDRRSNSIRSLSNITAELALPFIKGLSIKALAGYDYITGKSTSWSSNFMNASSVTPYVSTASENQNNSTILMGNIGLTYNRSFGDHNISAIVYQEVQKSTQYSSYMSAENLSTQFHQIGSSPGKLISMGAELSDDFRLLSTLGRVVYNYKSKYLIEGSVRCDATSKFSPDRQTAIFGAIGAGWILNEEKFIKDINWIELLKIRGSFGQSGNGSMPDFKYLNTYSTDKQYMNLQYTYIKNIGNSVITWETSNNTDIGLDFGLFKNKINGSIAYYNKDVNGLLLEAPLPMSAGVPGGNAIWANIGRMRNKGIEFSVSYSPIRNKDFSWDLSFNISTNKNEVIALHPAVDVKGTGIESTATPTITRAGDKLATFYLPEFAGIDPQTGLAMIYERDTTIYATSGKTVRTGNKVPLTDVSGAANKFVQTGKSSMPDWYGGLNNELKYKNFDLSVNITYSVGSYFFNEAAQYSRNLTGNFRLADDIITNSWMQPGDNAKYPQLTLNNMVYIGGTGAKANSATTQDLVSNSYIRVRFLTFGYSLPAKEVNRLKINSLRFYATVSNPFTLSNAPAEINPDMGIPGNLNGNIVNYGLAPIRYYSIGTSINF
jgi:TonB-linked SusC/RagA family outer membrane protein